MCPNLKRMGRQKYNSYHIIQLQTFHGLQYPTKKEDVSNEKMEDAGNMSVHTSYTEKIGGK